MKPIKYVVDILRGMVIGLANLIPGVSGSMILKTLGYYEPFCAMMRSTAEKGFMSESVLALYTLCDTPEQALAAVTAPAAAVSVERGIADYGK